MSDAPDSLYIRRLWPTDQAEIDEHFARLDRNSRHMRFGGAVSDEFVREYAARLLELGSVAYGAFPDR